MTSLKYSPSNDSNPENNFSRFHDTYFTKELLKRLDKFKDNEEISLEESIPVLYELNLFQELTSIPDAKRRLTQDTKPNLRLQIEARFIYNLWKLIGQQFIQMRDFKKIVTIFITEEVSDLAIRLEEIFEGQNALIIEILAIWQAMLENNSHQSSYQEERESSVLTEEGNCNKFSNIPQKYSKQSSSKYNIHNYSTNSIQQNRISLNNNEKQNQRKSMSKTNQTYTERPGQKTRRQNIEEVRDEIYNSNLYEIPVLTVEKEKQLVNRLYVVNKYERYQEIKKMQDQEKLQKQLEECTFRPNIDKEKIKRPDTAGRNKTSRTHSKPIPGYQKAIQRMKIGQQKTKELKEKLELRNICIKQNKEENIKSVVPPKFLARQTRKDEKKVLFTIQFDIGRHKMTCKIHENDSAEQLAKNIQSIYKLKQDSYTEIKGIIEQEMQRYFQISQQERQNYNQVLENHENQFANQIEQSNQKSQHFIFG